MAEKAPAVVIVPASLKRSAAVITAKIDKAYLPCDVYVLSGRSVISVRNGVSAEDASIGMPTFMRTGKFKLQLNCSKGTFFSNLFDVV